MSSDNNNLSTSAQPLKCHYRSKYEKWYWSLINECPKTRPKSHKTECHHIVPKCLGGSKTGKENLCYPTPRLHFVLHRCKTMGSMIKKFKGDDIV